MTTDSQPDLERLYRLMVEQARDYGLFILDTDGRVRSWNLGAQRIKGYQPGDIIGRHFSTFYTPEAVQSGWPAYELRMAAVEGRFEDEGWRVRKDGSRFWASVVITALRDEAGRLLGYSKITRDLTDRRMQEEALRQSEERFRLLVEGVTDYSIFMLDADGLVMSWNPGAERIAGYQREEIIGKHFSRFFTRESIEAGKPWEELAGAKRTGRIEDEGWRVRKDGARYWARCVLTALRDRNGRLRGYAKVVQDLSERRHIEELEQTARNVSQFIAILAHELRNPLAPIRSSVSLLQAIEGQHPGLARIRQTLDRQSAQLTRMVDDLLDITRITRGKLMIERGQVDLREAVKLAAETAGPAVDGAKITLDLDLPEQPVHVRGDLHRLTQALANLLNNAAHYTAPGGRVAVRLQSEGTVARLSVRDTGRGIDPAQLEQIFDLFAQARSNAQPTGGLGIGLALSRRIAQLHGGTLVAYSEGEGRGAEFTMTLPLLDVAFDAPRREAEPSSASAPRQRILIVDDNVDAAATLHLLLSSLGHETCVAHDGQQALRLTGEFRPDTVLLDIGLPDMDGYEVARRLRAMGGEHPVRIIAVSGWGQESDRQRSREAGFDVHLVKPVDPQEIEKALVGTIH